MVDCWAWWALPVRQEISIVSESQVTMGLDLQPDGLIAGLAGHCQPDKKYMLSRTSASRETISHPQHWCRQRKKRMCHQCKSYQSQPGDWVKSANRRVTRKGQSGSATASLLIKRLSVHEGRNNTLFFWLRGLWEER